MGSSAPPQVAEQADTKLRRRLAAVLLTDVVSYTRMMALDDSSTVAAIGRARAAMSAIVQGGGGRVVNEAGDAFLAEFGSVIAAVQVAIDMQNALQSEQLALGGMTFRIGVHLGDVVERDGEIYGDGVNLAARLQTLAAPGAIAVSGAVYDAVRHKVEGEFTPLGKVLLKNVDFPVDVWMWRGSKREGRPPAAAGTATAAYRPPSHPVIRFTPFRSLVSSPAGRALAAALAEELLTLLSSLPSFSIVRGRAKTRGPERPDQTLYVLQGSLRSDGSNNRITVHLSEAETEANVWSGSYDLGPTAGLLVQERIARDIVTELQVKLTEGEHARLWTRATSNWRAWLQFQIGHHKEHLSTREGKLQARRHYGEALALDPHYVSAMAALGFCDIDEVRFGWATDPEQVLRQASSRCAEALAIDPDYPEAHALCAYVAVLRGDHRSAQAAIGKAVSLAPDSAKMVAYMGGINLYTGDIAAAAQNFERAMALTPHYAVWIAANLGTAYRLAGRLQDARHVFEQTYAFSPRNPRVVIGLIGVAVRLGQIDRAQELGRELLRIDPLFAIDAWARHFHFPVYSQMLREELSADLRAAGLS